MTAFSLQSSTGGGYSKYACSGETQSDGNILYQPAATMTLNSTHYMCFEVIKVVMQCFLREITGQLLPLWRKNPSQAYSTCTFPQMVLAHHPFLCQLVQIPAAHADVARSLLRQSKTTAHMSPAVRLQPPSSQGPDFQHDCCTTKPTAETGLAKAAPGWRINTFTAECIRFVTWNVNCLIILIYLFLKTSCFQLWQLILQWSQKVIMCRILYPLFDLGFVDNVNCCDNDSDFVDVPLHT